VPRAGEWRRRSGATSALRNSRCAPRQAEEAAPSPLFHSAFDPLPTRTRSARAPGRVPRRRQSQQRARAGRGPGPGWPGTRDPGLRGHRCLRAAAAAVPRRRSSLLCRRRPARIPSCPARPGPNTLTPGPARPGSTHGGVSRRALTPQPSMLGPASQAPRSDPPFRPDPARPFPYRAALSLPARPGPARTPTWSPFSLPPRVARHGRCPSPHLNRPG
jgi:hypothetical protein